ncbi:MAG: hypothetical protein IH921_12415 [Gemmatimonadetes bacterium]|nr:hypothetical protein [Gemmatimonadota bacterium]
MKKNEPKSGGLTRRDFLEGTGAVLVVAGAAPKLTAAEPRSATATGTAFSTRTKAPSI